MGYLIIIILKNGDIVGVDISVIKDGYIADSCWSYAIGVVSEEGQYLLTHIEKALFKGLNQVKDGVHLGNVSFVIEKYSRRANLGIVKELAGHGVGTQLHEEPLIPNYGKKNRGIIMQQGMTLAIEPMLNLGSEEIYMDEDSWSVKTMDGSNSAHFEHTIVVTNYGYEIITIERTKEEIESFSYNK